jgi:galactokinase
VFGGNIPIGSGLSSSAALECGFAFALNALFDLKLTRAALATLGQRAENRFVGVACGIMDQFASMLGQKDRLFRLDCMTLDFSYMPFDDRDLLMVLCDSQVQRTLTDSEYNERRAQCMSGVTVLAQMFPGVHSLRDATLDMIDEARDRLHPKVYRRCRYVVGEIHRVLKAGELLQYGDMEGFGALMNLTHAGLRDDYEVSCTELDILAEEAMRVSGVLGSRMMGAGFGGCTINLVKATALGSFREIMETVFRDRLGRPPVLYPCRLADGASEEA